MIRIGLPSAPSASSAERVGVLAAELEDVPDLDAAGRRQRAAAVGRGVALAHLGGLDRAVRGEVAAGDEVDDVVVGLVGAGDPRGAGDDPRVDEVAHAVRGQRRRADVALDQERVGREVRLVEQRDLGRVERAPPAASCRPRGRRARRRRAASTPSTRAGAS